MVEEGVKHPGNTEEWKSEQTEFAKPEDGLPLRKWQASTYGYHLLNADHRHVAKYFAYIISFSPHKNPKMILSLKKVRYLAQGHSKSQCWNPHLT